MQKRMIYANRYIFMWGFRFICDFFNKLLNNKKKTHNNNCNPIQHSIIISFASLCMWWFCLFIENELRVFILLWR